MIRYDRIREFLDQDEGDPPPVFVGRGTVLDDILDIAVRKAGRPKVTRILEGAPGAGKTSLLHEMRKRWTGEGGTPRVVTLSSTDLTDDTAVGVGAVLDAWTMDRASWKGTVMDRLKQINAIGAGPGGPSVGFSDAEIPGTLRMVANRYPKRECLGPIIVAVDEAQRFAGDQTTPEARFLQAIHDGTTGLPLTLVLAGLSDTAARARQMQLTRSIAVHEIRGLESTEPGTFMEKLCQHFGLDISRHITRLHDLAGLCDSWPRHLHHAGVELAEEALRVNGDMDRIDWDGVTEETLRRRQDHYRSQYSPQMRKSRSLTAAVMRIIPNREAGKGKTDVSEVEILNSIQRHHRADGPVEWMLPKGMDNEDFLAHLVHQGAIYIDSDGRIHSPIPSFRSYLIGAEAGQQPEPSIKTKGGEDSAALGF